jgi:ornithine carbamoyltransferase
VSFEMGIRQLGGEGLFLSGADIQLGRSETIADTIRVLQRFDINGVMIRTFKQSDVEELARYGDIPVINGLTDLCHPCQVLADLLTVWEHKGRLSGLKLAFFGDGFNMANSLLAGFAKCGVNVAIACPKGGYEPDKRFIAEAEKYADITITHDPKQAAKGADIVYTDVFFSMGEAVDEEKRRLLTEFQVDGKIMAAANDGAIFMHCLPAHRGEEVTESVLESPASVVFDEAENRLHAQKAVLYYLMR